MLQSPFYILFYIDKRWRYFASASCHLDLWSRTAHKLLSLDQIGLNFDSSILNYPTQKQIQGLFQPRVENTLPLGQNSPAAFHQSLLYMNNKPHRFRKESIHLISVCQTSWFLMRDSCSLNSVQFRNSRICILLNLYWD